jgi:streptogramin lyase
LVVTTQNIWAVNSGGSVSELNAAGVPLTSSGISCGGTGAAVDNAGSIWSLSPSTSSVCKLSNVGAVLLSGATGGGISAPSALAIDGAGQVWIANGNNSVSVLSNAGAAITPSSGYTDNTISGPNAIAIDNSGNVWLSNATSSSVDEILGAAVPVAPLANAVQNSTLGAKP